jgi:hypothetical protein
MKRSIICLSLVCVAMVSVAGLRADGPDALPATRPALEAIRYERTGGFAGTHDVVEITKEGAIVVQGKLIKSGTGQLTKDQMAKLQGLFDQWKDLKPAYPAPAGSADGFTMKIRYGEKEVTANEMNKDLPESFKAAQAAVEELAKGVAGK